MAADYGGKSPAEYLIPRAPTHLKYWFDQSIWSQAQDLQAARQAAARDPRRADPSGASATAAGGEITFHGAQYWADPEDTDEDVAADLARYPIGGPVKSTAHAVAS
jgi:hypothetical protein